MRNMTVAQIVEESYYNKPLDDLIKRFNTDPERGLKPSEIDQRHVQAGYNELPKIKKSIWKILIMQFT